jgi:hypothetical protein
MRPSALANYLLCALLVIGAAVNAGASPLPPDMTLDVGIKAALLNKDKSELLRSFANQATLVKIPTEGETVSAIKFALYGSNLTLYLENSVVRSIEARDRTYRTESGLRVGDSLKSVRAKHKEGKFNSGSEEGGFITYQIENGVTFVLRHTCIPYERFLDGAVHIEDADVLDCEVESIWVR